MAPRVSLEAFLGYVAGEMAWEQPLSEATELDDDLCVDSVARYELLCVVEDLGVVLDEARLGEWQTVGDLYRAYAAAPSSPSGRG
jgi:acyl carrier protein